GGKEQIEDEKIGQPVAQCLGERRHDRARELNAQSGQLELVPLVEATKRCHLRLVVLDEHDVVPPHRACIVGPFARIRSPSRTPRTCQAKNKPAVAYAVGVYGSGGVLGWCQAHRGSPAGSGRRLRPAGVTTARSGLVPTSTPRVAISPSGAAGGWAV